MPGILYQCDPDKNILCNKAVCYIHGGPCSRTTRIQCAKQTDIVTIAFDVNQEDLDALDIKRDGEEKK